MAIAAEAKVPLVEVKAQQLEAGLWVGQSASNAPVIIFVENFDLFAGVRGKFIHTKKQDHESFINQLLVELDGFEKQDGVVLMATTRNLKQIDEALQRPGRMDRIFHLQQPTQAEREKILRMAAKETMDEDLIDFVDWQKLARVQCAGNPHFWVNEDGSYQEEGQKNTKGYIWEKAGTKLLCAILSLRVPSKSSQPCGEQATSMNSRSLPDYLEQRAIQKLLLIGYNGSETSTIFKQARVLYKDAPFSVDEREHIKLVIQSHVYSYIGTLLEGREHFEEESLNELRQKQSCDGSSSTLAGTKFI
ncbi:extra-large guanine nucleotide-binding protein 1 [Phtheirospermum japonicum]|uniref:Extra-large guanine nucleotide-binding protein 1 n=1 Tax=Phtheirospermum japonicum TaxID=374723 RepID=A0A830CIE4_9LAMI|nr:extra-large guanine nucleotide-binding protein 1 [Phtheirospermum japonicum]